MARGRARVIAGAAVHDSEFMTTRLSGAQSDTPKRLFVFLRTRQSGCIMPNDGHELRKCAQAEGTTISTPIGRLHDTGITKPRISRIWKSQSCKRQAKFEDVDEVDDVISVMRIP